MPTLAKMIDHHDWAGTALGNRVSWPRSLKTILDLMLASKFAMCISWGPELTLFYNDAYVPFLGRRHPDALGRPIAEVWSEVWADIAPDIERAMAGEPVAYEDLPLTMTRHGYPEETWWTFAYSPVRDDDGRVAGFLDVATETTSKILNERRLMAEREKLAAREAELRALNADLEEQVVARGRERATTWNVSSELLSVIDLTTGRFDRVNPAWQSLGWLPEEMEGSSYTEFVDPNDVASSAAAFEQVRSGEPVPRFENRYRAKDGSWHWLSWVAVPFEGKLYSSARDVTLERRQAEELAKAEDALRQAQKLEAVGQLTGGVAHDFNNLLTVIRGSVDLLRRPGLTDERRERYVSAISETADRAAKLTGQLLAFARRQSLKPEIFDAGASIQEVASIVRTLTGSRVVLETTVPADACYVLADRGQFDTAIINMSVNARDAMDGEGRLSIAIGPVSGIPAIRSHPPVSGSFVAVTIADDGSGITSDDVGRIFEPFFTTKEVGKGTGLGLSQVIGFAKQSNGDIRVESAVGSGTTFTLYLPRVSADGMVEEERNEPEQRVDGDGICVLVVEDNKGVGDFAVQALRELGYDTILAVNAAEALTELESDCDRFHIVFSDVVMPGMSGLELGQEIRRRHPEMPVILTSGYSHVLAQNGRYGFELLHKPYSIEQLSRVFRKAANWRTQNR
ncbi:PAS domain-containing protein [Sphingomonas sp.]|uniref:hybrid sensor histidine kinase/response regulator n=1 Tax=Sphingomonas sp. TaxID=28214 RepID=UPI003B003A5B